MKHLILASGSPRRKMLLQWAEIEFEVRASDVDEDFDLSKSPSEVAVALAARKNEAVMASLANDANAIVLAADTLVVLEGRIINKPIDRSDAIAILQQLSGKTHEVITGVCIRSMKDHIVFYDTTRVSFHPLTESQIEHYVDTYRPYDKAGAYAIQEWIGVVGIRSIEGDFYNVMGLPISRVIHELNRFFSR
jgi:septum formation protein